MYVGTQNLEITVNELLRRNKILIHAITWTKLNPLLAKEARYQRPIL